MLLECFKEEYQALEVIHPNKTLKIAMSITRKVAEMPIDSLSDEELKAVLELQKMQGRTWHFTVEEPKKIECKPYEWERFDK